MRRLMTLMRRFSLRRLYLDLKIWWIDGDIELMRYQQDRIRRDLASAFKERSQYLCELIELDRDEGAN